MTTALLDTCVLVPGRARDVPLEIASTGTYRPLREANGTGSSGRRAYMYMPLRVPPISC